MSDGKVFLGTPDSYLVAIDQKTGRELWRVNVDDSNQCGCSITSAPLVVKDKVDCRRIGRRQRASRLPDGVLREDRPAGVALVRDSRAGRKGTRDLEGRQLEDGRRIAMADRFVRSGTEPAVLGHGQRGGRFLRGRSQ